MEDSLLCDSKSLIEVLKKNGDKYLKLLEAPKILITYKHTVLIWNAESSSVLCVQLKDSLPKGASSSLLTLLLTTQPLFEVEEININCTGCLLILSGKNGIMVVKLPHSSTIGFSSGVKDEFLCKSWNIAERMFKCSNYVNVKKVAWYPFYEHGTYIVVLSTDNIMRIFDISDPEAANAKFEFSGIQNSFLPDITFSVSLGETAVDFDFGTASTEVFNDKQLNKIICPLYILKGNGDVFYMNTISKYSGIVFDGFVGPLTMYPQADDNYGIDACSLMCLATSPPVLVIGMTSGVLHHSIVLDNDDTHISGKQSSNSVMKYSSVEPQKIFSLYVYESIELSLSPVLCNNIEESNLLVRLYKDITGCSHYFCTHISGIYSIHLPLVSFLEAYNARDDSDLVTQLQGKDCIVEHLVCTKPLPTMDPIPILGVGITVSHISSSLICLLASWEFICLPISPLYKTFCSSLISQNLDHPEIFSQDFKNSFEQHIHQIFQRSITTPWMKFHESSNMQSSPQQWLELITNLSHRFREEYLQHLDMIQLQVQRRIKILQQQKKKQLEDTEQLLKKRGALSDRAAKLAEKYEYAFYNHQKLVEKMENILHQVQTQLPILSNAELAMKRELISTEQKLKNYDISVQQIKTKKEYQSQRNTASEIFSSTSFHNNNGEKGRSYITPAQLPYLKTVLGKHGEQLSEIMKKLKWLKFELDNS